MTFSEAGNGSRSFFCLNAKSHNSMKSNSLTVSSSRSREKVQVSNPFTWTTIQKFYNAMPGEVTSCKNIYETKMYTAALLAVLSIVFLPLVVAAYLVYCSAKKGGKE